MKTPKEKYMNDPEYNHLVKTLEQMLSRHALHRQNFGKP
jgi:hypothetical protein